MVYTYQSEWHLAFTEMNNLIKEGKLKTKEFRYNGFEEMRNAFYGLFQGDNIGKAIIKCNNQMTHYGNLYP